MKKPFFDLASTILVLLLLLFSSCSVVFRFGVVKATSATIVVPDDYGSIQDAIDNAKNGDTIFVKKGVYYESSRRDAILVIDKPVKVIGEDPNHTIIDAHNIMRDVVHITADGVTFANFIVGHVGPIFSSGCSIPEGVVKKASNYRIENVTFVRGADPSIFPEDIVLLEGNDVLKVSNTNGASFGDLILKDNATLIVDNFSAKPQTLRTYNNSRIILLNNADLFVQQVNGNTPMTIYLRDNASLSLTDSSTVSLVCRNNSQIFAKNSTFRRIIAHDNVVVELTNCTSYGLKADGLVDVSVYNSTFPMDKISGEAQVVVTESYVRHYSNSVKLTEKGKLWVINSTMGDDIFLTDESNVWFIDCMFSSSYVGMGVSDSSNLWFINSTWQHVTPLFLENQSSLWFVNCNNTTEQFQEVNFKNPDAKANSGYYFKVTVESTDGAPLEAMPIEVCLSNGTIIDTRITDINGNVQFILASRTWNNQTTEDFDSYTVKTSKGWSQTKTTVELDSNKQITMSIDVSAFGFFSDTNIILILVGILAGAITLVFLKKRK